MPSTYPNENQIHLEWDIDREEPASADPSPPSSPSITGGLEVATSADFDVGDPHSA